MTIAPMSRRHLLLAVSGFPSLSLVSGCRASLPTLSATETAPDAYSLLRRSAAAHGDNAFRQLQDVNVSYSGHWRHLVTKLQPTLVDAGYRGGSEERILLGENWIGQTHLGLRGRKQVVRQAAGTERGSVRVWFNGDESRQNDALDAAALVADAYALFLFGPMLLAKYLRDGRRLVMQRAGVDVLPDGKRRYDCEILRIAMQPGIGRSESDQLALYIDRETFLMRRVRFSLEGLESTRGALVDVDTLDSVLLHDIQWPTRFHEKLLRPAPLQVHDWRLTGLDVDRGLRTDDIDGSIFKGKALVPALALPRA